MSESFSLRDASVQESQPAQMPTCAGSIAFSFYP
jgi:hypothetical protein